MNNSTDVIIIGAGIAGLCGARRLTEAGMHVTLLEARDRLGGRIYTQHSGQLSVDVGAEFVHGRPEETLSLAAEGGVPIVPVKGNYCRKANGMWANAGHLMAEVTQLFEKMPAKEPDQSFRYYLDHSGADEEVKQQALRYVEGFHAANPSLISVQSLVRDSHAEEAIDGDHQYLMGNGYDLLVQAVTDRIERDRCKIYTNTVVNEIRWKKGQVTVRSSTAEFTAPRTITTLPLGVLKSDSVSFSPPLPEKQNAMSFLEMGPVIRVCLCFLTRFWERKPGMEDLSFLFTDDPQFPTWWANNPLPVPVLTAWAAGRYGAAISGLKKEEMI